MAVDRHGDRDEPGRGRGLTRAPPARLLDRDPARAGRREYAPQQGRTVPDARGDDDPVQLGPHAAHAAQVAGQSRTQLRHAGRIGISESIIGHLAQHAPERRQPGLPREARERGQRRSQVIARWGGHRARRCAESAGSNAIRACRTVSQGLTEGRRAVVSSWRPHRRPAPATRDQVALGGELRVGLHDDATRHAKLGGQRARRGHARTRCHSAAHDRLAQRVLGAARERAGGRCREIEIQLHLARDSDRPVALEDRPSRHHDADVWLLPVPI